MLAPGTRLGRYVVESLVGAGGMGEVYRARDEQLGRDVALKLLPAHLRSDPSALERFRREARAVAALSHPNVVAIFDFTTIENHDVAVTELLQGETLRRRLERGPLAVDEALRMMSEIAAGVAAAHSSGIVHRDLKPENIFLTERGETKVLDFGLAHVDVLRTSASSATDFLPTESGMVVGTVGYLAPEQIQEKPVRPSTDVFALGCLLFEMIAGRVPFQAETPITALMAVINEPAPRLSGKDPLLGPANTIVQRCLAKDPAARYRDAGALGRDVDALLHRSGERGRRPSSTRSEVRVLPGRSRLWWPGTITAGTLFLVALGAWWLLSKATVDAGYALKRSDLPRGEARSLVELALRADAAGNRPRAVQLLQEACRRDPSSAYACAFAFSFENASGRDADEWAREAQRRLAQPHSYYESLLVRYLLTHGDANLEQQLALANSILELRPEAWRLRLAVAHILLNRRDRAGALAQLQQIDVQQPDDRRLALVLADRAALGDADGAERDLHRSPLAARPMLRAYVEGRIAWSRGQSDLALSHYLLCVRLAAKDGIATVGLEARVLAAVAMIRLARWSQVEPFLGETAVMAQQSALRQRELQSVQLSAFVAHVRGDFDERDRRLTRAFELAGQMNPDESAALLLLALRLRAGVASSVVPPVDASDSTITGVQTLIEARRAFENGDRTAAETLLRRARIEGVDLSDMREEAELLAAQLGLPSTLLPPDPPYPVLLRYLAVFELERMKKTKAKS